MSFFSVHFPLVSKILFYFFKSSFFVLFLFYIYGYFTCMYAHVCAVYMDTRCSIPRTGVIDGYEQPHGC